MLKVKNVMTKNPETCFEDDTVFDAVKIMEREDCGAVPIVDNDHKCRGIITDRDICIDVVLKHIDPAEKPVKDLMSKRPLTCNPDDKLETVMKKMERQQVRRVPVIDKDKRVVGIISEKDIVEHKPKKDKIVGMLKGITR